VVEMPLSLFYYVALFDSSAYTGCGNPAPLPEMWLEEWRRNSARLGIAE